MYSTTFHLHNKDGKDAEGFWKQNRRFFKFISLFTRTSPKLPNETPRPGWKIRVVKYSLLGFTYANKRNNITIERGRIRCDELNYRFPGERISLWSAASIFETRCNQEVAVYFGESSMEYYYYYCSRQRSFRSDPKSEGQRFIHSLVSRDTLLSRCGSPCCEIQFPPGRRGKFYQALYINCLGLIERSLSMAKIYRGVKD